MFSLYFLIPSNLTSLVVAQIQQKFKKNVCLDTKPRIFYV